MKCPECKKQMQWTEGLLNEAGNRDMTVGKHFCRGCRIYSKPVESKAVKRGRRLAKEFKDLPWNDKRMLSLPGAVQIGILRARQNPRSVLLKLRGRKGGEER